MRLVGQQLDYVIDYHMKPKYLREMKRSLKHTVKRHEERQWQRELKEEQDHGV